VKIKQKKKKQRVMVKNRASILIFTLLILSILTVLTQQLVRSVLIGYNFSSGQLAQQQARTLALGGIQLAISQLEFDKKSEEKDNQKEKTEDQKLKDFLKRNLPNINLWQEFDLKEDADGIDGSIKFCITCENGKININKAFDFNKLEFKDGYKAFLKGLEIKNKLKSGQIEERLSKFLKERKKPLDDISELINVPGLENISSFYVPPKLSKNKKNIKPNSTIYLQDMFTIWTQDDKLQILFLSDSMRAVMGLRRQVADDNKELNEKFKVFIKSFSKDWLKEFQENWKNFTPIFGKNNKTLKLAEKILSQEFGAKVYSVLSCGKVKNVEQKLLVVLKELDNEESEFEEKKGSVKEKIDSEKKKEEKTSKKFQIIRMYWL
jgi:hypothetical protein